ncbi:Cobalt-zinc-cadmium resistance protein CzcD [hydrothermal vent metagenome]|uniref:Cobalt-zinc-cadmium resistance protein CzcD n=1 Tax=hydrothermal vent metagenome TaxID=652676 RepID=A0A3B0S4V8_9ZZZZ
MSGQSGHGLSHIPTGGGSNSRALVISGWLTGIYFVIELGIGLYTGSVAVISDAFHTFSAVGGVVLAFVAARIAARPADKTRTFGSVRAEIIGALLNGAFLLVMAIIVIVMGSMRLQNPLDLPTTPMLWAAAGGLFTEVISLWLLYSKQKDDLNMKGAFWHVMQTFVGSILIIITALVIKYTGFLLIDPILGIAFGFVLLYASWGIMKEAVFILMEGAPQDIDLDDVMARLQELPGVTGVHHVHAWTLTSNRHVFSAHLLVEKPKSNEKLLKQAHGLLRKDFNFYFSTVQIETSCTDEDPAHDLDITAHQHG